MLTYNPFEKLRTSEPQEKEKKEKKSPFLSVLDDRNKAVYAVVDIESQWKDGRPLDPQERQEMEEKVNSAAFAIREQVDTLKKNGLSEKEAKKEVGSSFNGLGGFNRYSVHGDGTICLSSYHSIGPCIEAAKEWGIGVTPEKNDRETWSMPCPCGSGEGYGRCHGHM